MGFTSTKSTSAAKLKTEAVYRNIGNIWESRQYKDQYSIIVRDEDYTNPTTGKTFPAAGQLFFKDNESGKYFQVKRISMFEVDTEKDGGAKAFEKGIRFNLVLNLKNENSVKEISTDDETVKTE